MKSIFEKVATIYEIDQDRDMPVISKLREVVLSKLLNSKKTYECFYTMGKYFSDYDESWCSGREIILNKGDRWAFDYSTITDASPDTINRLGCFLYDVTAAYILFNALYANGLSMDSDTLSLEEGVEGFINEIYCYELSEDELMYLRDEALDLYAELKQFPEEDSYGFSILKGISYILGGPLYIPLSYVYEHIEEFAYCVFVTPNSEFWLQVNTYSSKWIKEYMNIKPFIPVDDEYRQLVDAAICCFESPLCDEIDAFDVETYTCENEQWYSVIFIGNGAVPLTHVFFKEAVDTLEQYIPLLIKKYGDRADLAAA